MQSILHWSCSIGLLLTVWVLSLDNFQLSTATSFKESSISPLVPQNENGSTVNPLFPRNILWLNVFYLLWKNSVQNNLNLIPKSVNETSLTWNALLRADGIFPNENDLIPLEYIQSQPDSSDVASSLKLILRDKNFLHKFYRNYKGRYHKEFFKRLLSKSERKRFKKIFLKNILKIAKHNVEYETGKWSWRMGVNQFTDNREDGSLRLSYETLEWTMRDESFTVESSLKSFDPNSIPSTLLPSVDWRFSGMKPRNQGYCGSCYSFASISLLEAAFAKSTGQNMDLSEQEVLDCSKKLGNFGCGGGFYEAAMTYMMHKGVSLETDYGNVSNGTSKSGKCKARRKMGNRHRVRVVGKEPKYFFIGGDEEKLKKMVAHIGPIGVSTLVGLNFFLYDGGVYDDFSHSNDYGHAFVIVGYGRERGQDYWLLKNSWGTIWGDGGYMKFKRGTKLKELYQIDENNFQRGYYFNGAQVL